MRAALALTTLLLGCSTPALEHDVPTSMSSLQEQQALHGWGPDQCAPPAAGVSSGFLIGDQLGDLVFKDCEGHDVDLRELCGADALWLSIAHVWCPHCQENGENQERMHDELAAGGKNLASVSILLEGNTLGEPATAEHCSSWRSQFAQRRVLTFYDPAEVSVALFEHPITALNVVIDRDRIIRSKIHTDVEGDIADAVRATLPP